MRKIMMSVMNDYGVEVKRCCASCAFKELSRLATSRICSRINDVVKPDFVCGKWEMSEQLKMAGLSQGGMVKRKEYLTFLVNIREEESDAEQMGLKIKPKSIATVRAEFERLYGSIYMDI